MVFEDIEDAIAVAHGMRKRWIAVEESGEVWAGNGKPEYHEYFPIWVWPLEVTAVKIGWYKRTIEWKYARYSVERMEEL